MPDRIAFLGGYDPRRCGIATFTHDICEAVAQAAKAMKTAHNEAETEARQKLAQQEAGKVTSTFKPTYECLLQYVSERRLSP